jgi:uncharacterized protein (DUF2164 family)
MAIELSKQEVKDITASIQRYFDEELEIEINEMRAGFLLNYILKEIAPFAYNKGVRDAETFFRDKIEDLPGTCFEDGLTYWEKKKKKG